MDRQNSSTAQPGMSFFYQNVEVRATISPTLALEDEKMEKNVTAAVSKHGGTQAY